MRAGMDAEKIIANYEEGWRMTDIQVTNKTIDAWQFLTRIIRNQNAVAGIMGYFQARTGFDPLKGFVPVEEGWTCDRKTFIYDKKAYGMGAWDIWYDKLGWWNLAKKAGYPLSSVEAQLYFFCEELKGTTHKVLCEALKHVDNPADAARLMYDLYPGHEMTDKMLNDIQEASMFFYDNFVRPIRKVRYVKIIDEEAWVKTRPSFLGKRVGKAIKGETFTHIITTKNGKWESIN